MRYMNAVCAATMVAGLLTGCGGDANVTGTWKGTVNGTGAFPATSSVNLVLGQSGKSLSGTFTLQGGGTATAPAAAQLTGTIDGNNITYTVTPQAGCTRTDTATVNGSTMTVTGSMTCTPATGNFTYSGTLTRQ